MFKRIKFGIYNGKVANQLVLAINETQPQHSEIFLKLLDNILGMHIPITELAYETKIPPSILAGLMCGVWGALFDEMKKGNRELIESMNNMREMNYMLAGAIDRYKGHGTFSKYINNFYGT